MKLPFELDFTSVVVGYIAGVMLYNSIATLVFAIISISDEIFRLYTSVVIGVIPAIYFIFKVTVESSAISIS